MKTVASRLSLALLGGLAVILGTIPTGSCGAAEPGATAVPLRVGITPEYPPLVFRQPDGTNGLEIDLATELGRQLRRPVEFVVVNFADQIPALLDRRTDIIMTGMSVTKARQLKIAFSNPYVQNELRAIYLLQKASRYNTPEKLFKTTDRIGVIAGTTGEIFASRNCTNAEIIRVDQRRDVGYFLKSGRVHVFLDDTFALAEIYSKHESEITYLEQPLSKEDLAWGIRPDETEFLNQVNSVLAAWKADGTLDRALKRWIPYLPKPSTGS